MVETASTVEVDPSPPPPSRRRSPVTVLLLSAAILAAIGYGYWKLIFYPTTAQYAIDQFLAAVKTKDYDRVYAMVKVPGPVKVFVGSGQALRSIVERNPAAVPEIRDHRFGPAAVTGDQATVETSITSKSGGTETTSTVRFKLIRANGVWLIDGQWIMAEVMKRGLGGMLMNNSD